MLIWAYVPLVEGIKHGKIAVKMRTGIPSVPPPSSCIDGKRSRAVVKVMDDFGQMSRWPSPPHETELVEVFGMLLMAGHLFPFCRWVGQGDSGTWAWQ